MSKGIRIPLADAISQCNIIENLLQEYSTANNTPILEYMIVGSIRRKTIDCGDGDIVFWEKDRETLTSIINLNKNLFSKIEAMKSGKINNVTMSSGFKIDFWFAKENCWWHKIQFYTGSWDYNEVIIKNINMTGKYLGRIGFYDELGKQIIVNSEEELFSMYNINYTIPENRSLTNE